jgi:restriction endonuclease S subunit
MKTKALSALLGASIGGVWGEEPGGCEAEVFVFRSTELKADGSLNPGTAVRRSITARQLGSRELQRGDLLLEKSGGGPKTPVGRVGIVGQLPGPSVCSNFMLLMRPRPDDVEPEYLHYYLNHFHATGGTESLQNNSTNIRNLRTAEYLDLEVPVPTIDEQRRIVALLDEATEYIATLEAVLDREARELADMRRSAVDGLLAGIGPGAKRLDEVCDVFVDGDWIESKDQSSSGIRLVQTGNVGDGIFKDRRDKARWIDQTTFDRLRCTEIHAGDLLISRLPEPVGRACMIPDTGDRMITAVDCTIARPDPKVAIPEFLVLYMSSSSYFEQVRSMITGTTRDRISRKNLGSVRVPTPSIEVQIDLVARSSAIDAACRDLASNLETRTNLVRDLRQSALEAAFRGEL